MKKTNCKYPHLTVHRYEPAPAYPNTPCPSYFTDRALDILTGIVSFMGLVTATVFLVTLA